MPGFDANEILGTMLNGIVKVAESVPIIRDPVESHGKTIFPAVIAKVGLGAGGKSGRSSGDRDEEGSGGGGGMTLTPVFLIIDDQGERLITVPDTITAASGLVINQIKEMAGEIFSGKFKGQ